MRGEWFGASDRMQQENLWMGSSLVPVTDNVKDRGLSQKINCVDRTPAPSNFRRMVVDMLLGEIAQRV